MESRSSYAVTINKIYVKPSCTIDWANNITDSFPSNDSRANYGIDCGTSYLDINFTQSISKVSNSAVLGIGSNNNGAYCSMRFAAIPSVNVSGSYGWAQPCNPNEYNIYDMYLWFK